MGQVLSNPGFGTWALAAVVWRASVLVLRLSVLTIGLSPNAASALSVASKFPFTTASGVGRSPVAQAMHIRSSLWRRVTDMAFPIHAATGEDRGHFHRWRRTPCIRATSLLLSLLPLRAIQALLGFPLVMVGTRRLG